MVNGYCKVCDYPTSIAFGGCRCKKISISDEDLLNIDMGETFEDFLSDNDIYNRKRFEEVIMKYKRMFYIEGLNVCPTHKKLLEKKCMTEHKIEGVSLENEKITHKFAYKCPKCSYSRGRIKIKNL